MKWAEMLVVSFRGVNFGFWSHIGCSEQNATKFSCQGLMYGCTRRNFYSVRGQKSLGHAQIGLL